MFLFNGQYGVASDDNGLYYMRARYYNISIKRFINQDVVTGNIAESQSLNRYAYVEGNPVSYLDPFGLEPLQTEGLHRFAEDMSIAGGLISVRHPTAGYLIGEAAFFFDLGVYINDVFTSGFNGEVVKDALSSCVKNGRYFVWGTASYFEIFDEASEKIGKLVTRISAADTLLGRLVKSIKKWFEKNKKRGSN